MNDKRANIPVLYHNILKHDWNLSFTGIPCVCHLIDCFSAYWFANLPLSLSYYWSLLTAYIHNIYCFTSNNNIFCIFLRRFALFHCVVIYCHLPALSFSLLIFFLILHFYSVMVSWLVLRFLSLYVTLLIFLVIGKLHVMWLNTWSRGSLFE